MKKYKINLPIKPVASYTAIIIVLFFFIVHLSSALKKSDYFKIKDIIVNKPQGLFDFSYLSGRNIFDIDLKKESRYISEQYPVYKKVGLFRILPDRLFIGFVDRRPIAYVKLYRDFCVDPDRVLFDPPQGNEAGDFPVIVGLDRKIPGPRPGRQYNIKELITALNIIKETQANNLLRKYKIERVDARSPVNISCFIRIADNSEGQALRNLRAVEVKIGQEDIAQKIRVLAGLLTQLGDDISNINYIDLRFSEPVVKLNKDKSEANAAERNR